MKEAIEFLVKKEDGIYIDATVGFGGHARGILSKLNEKGKVIGIDRDLQAVSYLREVLVDNRFMVLHGNFSDLFHIAERLKIIKIDGILFDLGVSLLHFKESNRGFSFLSEARLDMRMDTSEKLSAWDVVNKYSQSELERIFTHYGEERYAKKIADAIIHERKKKAIETCKELALIVEKIRPRKGRIHPATKIFQAIRVEVNEELENLKKGILSGYDLLKSAGRLCVISYHSLEDRLVKNFLRDKARDHKMKIITKKPITPSLEETRLNPSSRSAKLRVGEKI